MAHQHSHQESSSSGRGILVAMLLNVGIVVVQIVGGFLSGSLSLLADAIHNASDAASLGISYVARRVARRPPDTIRTFGYSRVETLAAVINLTTLIVITLYLIYEAIIRFNSPHEIQGRTMLIVGAIAFAEDLVSVVVLLKSARESMNVRSAMLHLVGDTLSTLAVMIGAVAVILFDWTIVDPILTILISVFIFVHAYRGIREAAAVLVESTPKNFDYDKAVKSIFNIQGVENIHHVHVWQLNENRTALEAHIVVHRKDVQEMELVKSRIRELLHDRFGIEHSTLEIEFSDNLCHDDSILPKT